MPDLPVRSGFLINNCQKLSSLSYDSNTSFWSKVKGLPRDGWTFVFKALDF